MNQGNPLERVKALRSENREVEQSGVIPLDRHREVLKVYIALAREAVDKCGIEVPQGAPHSALVGALVQEIQRLRGTPAESPARTVIDRADDLFKTDPDWVTFFRDLVGVDGAVRLAYPALLERRRFERSPVFGRVLGMLDELRRRDSITRGPDPMRVITVRVPKSLHDVLKTEATENRVSMNVLCMSKLVRPPFIGCQADRPSNAPGGSGF